MKSGYFLQVTILAATLGATLLSAGVYYVDKNNPQASDGNSGTESVPWLTIQHAADVLAAGDTVLVKAGSYSGDVYTRRNGSAGRPITFQRYGTDSVAVTGMFWLQHDYIVLRGFEFPGYGIRVDKSYCLVEDNYCHDAAGGDGIAVNYYGNPGVGHNVIRHNRIADCGWDNVMIGSEYNVFEYNEISSAKNTGGDIFKWPGNNLLLRGNYIHDVADANGSHVDIIQFGGSRNVFFIGNRIARINNQTFFGGPAVNMVYRSNLLESIRTNYTLYFSGTGMRVMNNTFDVISCYQFGALGDNTTAILQNNIIYNIGSSNHYSYGGGTGTTIVDDYNYVYQWGLQRSHDISGGDPGFTDYANNDYHLQSTSVCRDAGCFLTTTTGPGSGTQIPVEDAYMFCDGFGLVDGDSVQLGGQSQTAKIISIDYPTNTLTLDRSLTWTNGQGVSLPYSGPAPDMGAYEYSATGITVGEIAPGDRRTYTGRYLHPGFGDMRAFGLGPDTKIYNLAGNTVNGHGLRPNGVYFLKGLRDKQPTKAVWIK